MLSAPRSTPWPAESLRQQATYESVSLVPLLTEYMNSLR